MRKRVTNTAPQHALVALSTTRYGVTRHTDDPTYVEVFVEVTRDGKTYWKSIGTARWNDVVGLYSLPGGLPASVAMKLGTLIRTGKGRPGAGRDNKGKIDKKSRYVESTAVETEVAGLLPEHVEE